MTGPLIDGCAKLCSMPTLLVDTPKEWLEVVVADMDAFLVDHAACERKASAAGMSFVVRYPDRPWLLGPMITFAQEELSHFAAVFRIVSERGLQLTADEKDPYVTGLMKHVRTGREERLLDRLLCCSIMEARGCERFALLADALPKGKLQSFYQNIARSEARHTDLFVELAGNVDSELVAPRLGQLLEAEAEIVNNLSIRPALH